MAPVPLSKAEYMRRLIPRPISFHLAKKQENAFNLGHQTTEIGDEIDKTTAASHETLCSYNIIRKVAEWEKPARAGAGLHNLGNTCYLNSVIQCLTHTAPLAGLCLNGYFEKSLKIPNESSLKIFVQHVKRALAKQGGGSFAPKSRHLFSSV